MNRIHSTRSERVTILPFPEGATGIELPLRKPVASRQSGMIQFFKSHASGRSGGPALPGPLGRLEAAVMEIVWARGEGRVHDVVEALDRPLAYTTVMTTLDRLFKKGLLGRTKQDRAFVYSPRLTREEWERQRAGDLVADFLAAPGPSRELLLSCFLDAMSEHDILLLDELEKQIRRKRQELSQRGGS